MTRANQSFQDFYFIRELLGIEDSLFLDDLDCSLDVGLLVRAADDLPRSAFAERLGEPKLQRQDRRDSDHGCLACRSR